MGKENPVLETEQQLPRSKFGILLDGTTKIPSAKALRPRLTKFPFAMLSQLLKKSMKL